MHKRNLTARQVEIMTGISKSTINRIANNRLSPTMEVMEQLAKGLGVKISDLYSSDFQ